MFRALVADPEPRAPGPVRQEGPRRNRSPGPAKQAKTHTTIVTKTGEKARQTEGEYVNKRPRFIFPSLQFQMLSFWVLNLVKRRFYTREALVRVTGALLEEKSST